VEQLLAFVVDHPYLVGSFAVLLALFVRNEMVRGGTTVSSQELVAMVNSQDALVLDIRDKKEFEEGHIVDAINIPHGNLESRVDELKKYKEKPIVITCKQGQHSGAAGTALKKMGFEHVTRLRGGLAEWRGANMPVVKA